MLGGGVFVTQNKILPGSYINFVNASDANSALGERGVVALAALLGDADNKIANKVITITKAQFVNDCFNILGFEYNSSEAQPLREVFCHASKVHFYGIGDGDLDIGAICSAFEPYEFNVLCFDLAYEIISEAVERIKYWRDELGKKCQIVVYNADDEPDYEGVINVVSTVSDELADEYALVPWVAGAMAGCKVNESCTNMVYDGEFTIVTNKTQEELETCIKNGQIAFHLVYDKVRLLEDVNSLVTTTADKGEDFKSNQTIRVIDQIANDIAKLFNTKYLGRIPNNASGRISLWADIVAHHKALEAISAIESFDSAKLTVERGANKKSVVINDCITVINAMAQLYMTVVVK